MSVVVLTWKPQFKGETYYVGDAISMDFPWCLVSSNSLFLKVLSTWAALGAYHFSSNMGTLVLISYGVSTTDGNIK